MSIHRLADHASLCGLIASCITGTASADNDLQISINANVPPSCAVAQVTRATSANGSVLSVATNCNAPDFRIEFDGVPGLNLLSARPGENAGASLTVFPDAVELAPTSPAFQVIDVDFTNSLVELEDIIIDIVVG